MRTECKTNSNINIFLTLELDCCLQIVIMIQGLGKWTISLLEIISLTKEFLQFFKSSTEMFSWFWFIAISNSWADFDRLSITPLTTYFDINMRKRSSHGPFFEPHLSFHNVMLRLLKMLYRQTLWAPWKISVIHITSILLKGRFSCL